MDEILARLERIEGRLDALEGRAFRVPPEVAAPPIVAAPPVAKASGEALEAELGSRWLPRAGAVAVVAAIAYLVGLGLQRGVITPPAVAFGVAAACALVALVGTRMRGSRETYGNVLVGLAAGGLYVDAVGSYAYHEMLSGRAMVLLCVAVSLGALAFGARRALPSFLGIGLFGGLLASVMPLSKGDVAASTTIFLLVAAPSFGIAAKRRWPSAAMGAWLASFLAALAILFSKGDLALRLVPVDAAMLMALAAWAWALGDGPTPESDPQGAFPFLCALATATASLVAFPGTGGALHVALLGAVAATGLLVRRQAARRVGGAGLMLTLCLAPLGLDPVVAATLLALASLAETLAWWALRDRDAGLSEGGGLLGVAAIVTAQAALALACYGYAALAGAAIAYEVGLLALLGVAAAGAANVVGRREARVVAGIVAWGLATRFATLGIGLPESAAITVAWLAVFVVLMGLGFARQRPELRQLGLAVAAATAGKVAFVDLANLDAAFKAAVLLGLGVVLLAGGYTYVRWSTPSGEK